MGKLIFELSDDERAMLEVKRIQRGLRSHAETLRALIREEAGELKVRGFPPGPTAWPNGSVILPEHKEDPGPDAPLVMVQREMTREELAKKYPPAESPRPPRAPYGSRLKGPKPTKGKK